jgi:hypothetical protein
LNNYSDVDNKNRTMFIRHELLLLDRHPDSSLCMVVIYREGEPSPAVPLELELPPLLLVLPRLLLVLPRLLPLLLLAPPLLHWQLSSWLRLIV